MEKLNKLKELRLDSGWKAETRDVLFSQISNSVDNLATPVEKVFSPAIVFKKIMSFTCQPTAIVAGVFV